jgi:hypothetical protein
MHYFEKMFYESRPFLYAFIGLYAVAHYDNKTLVVSGLTLLFCSAMVFNMRLTYREQMARIKASSGPSKNLFQ